MNPEPIRRDKPVYLILCLTDMPEKTRGTQEIPESANDLLGDFSHK